MLLMQSLKESEASNVEVKEVLEFRKSVMLVGCEV